MSNVQPDESGLPFVVYISERQGPHDVRVKIAAGAKAPPFVASVSVRPTVEVVAGKLSNRDLDACAPVGRTQSPGHHRPLGRQDPSSREVLNASSRCRSHDRARHRHRARCLLRRHRPRRSKRWLTSRTDDARPGRAPRADGARSRGASRRRVRAARPHRRHHRAGLLHRRARRPLLRARPGAGAWPSRASASRRSKRWRSRTGKRACAPL